MLFRTLTKSTFALVTSLMFAGCVSNPQVNDDNSSVVLGVDPVKPAQIGDDECVNYIQLERNAAYQCELANGETRPVREGERRSTPLSKEDIIQIIDKNMEDAEFCIAEAERQDPKAKGKIVINFEVEPDGKISDASVLNEKSSYKNNTASECLIGKIKSWRFPVLHNDDSLEIKFPFAFGEGSALNDSQSMPSGDPSVYGTKNSGDDAQSSSVDEIPNKKTIKKTRKN